MADTQHAPSLADNIVKEEDNLKSDENDGTEPPAKRAKNPDKTRQMRLEQNRKAARESRKRKKVLVEELQRSVIFFSRGKFSVCVERNANLLVIISLTFIPLCCIFSQWDSSQPKRRNGEDASASPSRD